MNRLRTRFILAFVGIILLVIIFPLNSSLLGRFLGFLQADSQLVELISQLPPESIARIQEFFSIQVPRQISRLVIIGAVIGTVAGLLMSQALTAPLHKLADAARAIDFQNLGNHVEVHGTEEIQALAQAFNEMTARLEKAETLRRNLLADVAHELRTPVTVIQGNLRAILDDVYPLEKEEVARLYEQTRLLTRLIDDLRELAQAEAAQLSLNVVPVDVAALVKETAAAFDPIAQSQNVALTVALLGSLPTIQADEARLRQSIHNLVDNALRHTPENGRILLQVERIDNAVQIRVQDSGRGMTPEQISHVFDRFYRADPSRSRESGGSGLGLAIVRAIAQAHGGEVTAVSPGLNQGSTFSLTLPAST